MIDLAKDRLILKLYMQELLYNTSYFWGVFLLSPLWSYMLFKLKNQRSEMIFSGFIFGIGAILIGRFYANFDYWNPPYLFGQYLPVEDFLYGFVFGGISTSIYQLLFRTELSRRKRQTHYESIFLFAIFTVMSFTLFVDRFQWNSIIAHIIPPLFVGAYISGFRRDLFKIAIVSGVIITVLTFLWQILILLIIPEAVIRFWFLEKLSGILIVGIPLEELLFAFALGFGASVYYEYLTGRSYKKDTSKNV